MLALAPSVLTGVYLLFHGKPSSREHRNQLQSQAWVGTVQPFQPHYVKPLELIKENLRDPNSRFLMVFTDNENATSLQQYAGLVEPLVLIGSDLEADLTNAYDYAMLRQVRRLGSVSHAQWAPTCDERVSPGHDGHRNGQACGSC